MRTGQIPCYFPANSLVNCESPVFMRVSEKKFFFPGKIPCVIPCDGNSGEVIAGDGDSVKIQFVRPF